MPASATDAVPVAAVVRATNEARVLDRVVLPADRVEVWLAGRPQSRPNGVENLAAYVNRLRNDVAAKL